MATLGSKTEGSTVKVKENGTWVDFYVSKHNYESSLNGANRTALVRKNCFTSLNWNTTGNNAYADSTLDTWLNGSYINSLDEDLREAIGTTKLYYSANGNSGVTVLERAIFVLSATELGGGESSVRNTEGSVFPIAEILKKATSNQWSRTPYDGSDRVAYFDTSGNELSNKVTFAQGARPAFTLPSETKVDENGNVIINQPPTIPSYISFETPKAGKNLGISWGESTDPDGDTIDYLIERQVDAGEWEQIAEISAITYTDVCPSSGTNVNYRVKANDRKGGESDYRTGTAKAIVYNQPPSVPASITFGDPHAGKPLQITCEASTDPDGNPITYIWEHQIDSSGWTQIGSGAETSITDTVPSSGTNYNVRVKARDSEGAESGYRTGSAKAIIYNQPPTIPGVPQYKYPIPGEEMPVKWQASTDPENGTVTYIVETKLGDGEWTQARETPETSCLVSVPQVSAAGTMIIVRVKAKDQEGAESAYSTGETAEILYHKVIRKIPWQQGKPFKARQYTYNGKKQYQTMREGALAGIEAEP